MLVTEQAPDRAPARAGSAMMLMTLSAWRVRLFVVLAVLTLRGE
jgi:hypothetical protein